MKTTPLSTIETVAYICLSEGKILLTKHKEKAAFYMPGGKKDNGEAEIAAIFREIKEELTIELIEDTLQHYGIFQAPAYGKPEGVHVKISCFTGTHRGIIKPDHEIEAARFFNYAEYVGMPETSLATRVILEDLKAKGLLV